MREVVFLRSNADKWKQFEALLRAPEAAEPDRLAELFVEVTDDLSYAKTFYPGSKTTRYLNDLAGEAHRALYRNRREVRSRFVTFWTHEVPRAAYAARRALALAAAVFMLALGIGLISAAGDAGFVRLILGDAYVNMTQENIAAGDPMAVYKQAHQVDMFLGIAVNNVRVAFTAFAMGLFFSFGTVFVLLKNGLMLGAFHYLFFEQGLLLPSLLVIYIHGALEIPAIVVAGGAGLALGNGMLFPGTHTRAEAFKRGAKRGAKLVVGLVPVFLTAAFLEGFVTRQTEMPAALSLLVITGSLGFVGWYFFWYPHRLAQQEAAGADETFSTV